MNIAIFAVFCAFVGAVAGYCIAEKQSQHAIFAARAKGILDGRSDAEWELQCQRIDLQRLRRRNRQLEAKEQVIRREST
jgi:hypothetical protein